MGSGCGEHGLNKDCEASGSVLGQGGRGLLGASGYVQEGQLMKRSWGRGATGGEGLGRCGFEERN